MPPRKEVQRRWSPAYSTAFRPLRPRGTGHDPGRTATDLAAWQPAKVKSKSDGSYKVFVNNPDSGYVSLRVKAQDTNGSKIEQTLIRAYAVR